MSQADLDKLATGITIDGVKYGPIVADLERSKGMYSWATVSLKEGKNREVKRVMERLGLKVARLIRTSYGPFQLGQLAEGQVERRRLWAGDPEGYRPNLPFTWGAQPHNGLVYFNDVHSGIWIVKLGAPTEKGSTTAPGW